MRIVLEPREVAAALRSQVRQVRDVRISSAGVMEIDVELTVARMRVVGTATIDRFVVDGSSLRADAVVTAGRLRAPAFALRMALARLWRPGSGPLPPGAVDLRAHRGGLAVTVDLEAIAALVRASAGMRLSITGVELGPGMTVDGELTDA